MSMRRERKDKVMNKKINDYYVLLALDEDSATEVRVFKMLDKKFNLPYKVFYPHLTLGHFPNASKRVLLKTIRKLSKQNDTINIDFNDVKLLNGNLIALTLDKQEVLEGMYDKLHQSIPFEADIWTSPTSGKFIPHVSIYFSQSMDLTEMYDYIKKSFVPFSGKLVAIELSLFDGKTYTIVKRFPIKKRFF